MIFFDIIQNCMVKSLRTFSSFSSYMAMGPCIEMSRLLCAFDFVFWGLGDEKVNCVC